MILVLKILPSSSPILTQPRPEPAINFWLMLCLSWQLWLLNFKEKTPDTQFWYITTVIRKKQIPSHYILSEFSISFGEIHLPKTVRSLLVLSWNPTVLWSFRNMVNPDGSLNLIFFWTAQTQHLFDSENFQMPRTDGSSYGTGIKWQSVSYLHTIYYYLVLLP